MAKQPKKPDNRRTLSGARQAMQHDDLHTARAIIRLFREIAAANPDVVIDAMNKRGTYLSTLTDDRKAGMVTFYHDSAEYLIELFDIK